MGDASDDQNSVWTGASRSQTGDEQIAQQIYQLRAAQAYVASHDPSVIDSLIERHEATQRSIANMEAEQSQMQAVADQAHTDAMIGNIGVFVCGLAQGVSKGILDTGEMFGGLGVKAVAVGGNIAIDTADLLSKVSAGDTVGSAIDGTSLIGKLVQLSEDKLTNYKEIGGGLSTLADASKMVSDIQEDHGGEAAVDALKVSTDVVGLVAPEASDKVNFFTNLVDNAYTVGKAVSEFQDNLEASSELDEANSKTIDNSNAILAGEKASFDQNSPYVDLLRTAREGTADEKIEQLSSMLTPGYPLDDPQAFTSAHQEIEDHFGPQMQTSALADQAASAPPAAASAPVSQSDQSADAAVPRPSLNSRRRSKSSKHRRMSSRRTPSTSRRPIPRSPHYSPTSRPTTSPSSMTSRRTPSTSRRPIPRSPHHSPTSRPTTSLSSTSSRRTTSPSSTSSRRTTSPSSMGRRHLTSRPSTSSSSMGRRHLTSRRTSSRPTTSPSSTTSRPTTSPSSMTSRRTPSTSRRPIPRSPHHSPTSRPTTSPSSMTSRRTPSTSRRPIPRSPHHSPTSRPTTSPSSMTSRPTTSLSSTSSRPTTSLSSTSSRPTTSLSSTSSRPTTSLSSTSSRPTTSPSSTSSRHRNLTSRRHNTTLLGLVTRE